MEGWFWRFTDVAHDRVVVVLCGINRHPGGDWATVAVATHPEGVVRSTAVDGAAASATRFEVAAADVLRADERALRVDLGDVHLHVELHDQASWPMRLGAGGVFSMLPYLGQYWHPHVLGGRVAGEITVSGQTWGLDGADVYAEKNWGAGFPDWWWWGQGQGFSNRDVCVAFGGGRLRAGPFRTEVTGCVLRIGRQVVRFAPPLAIVRTDIARGSWRVTARRRGWSLTIEADGNDTAPAVLPVPVPAERRNVDQDFEHLAGRMRLQVRRAGSILVDDETRLAALEVGSTDPVRAAALGADLGLRAPHH